jgi:hypothetical protein
VAIRGASRTAPSSPAKAGDPVFRGASDGIEKPSVLDTPLSRSMTVEQAVIRISEREIASLTRFRPLLGSGRSITFS